MYIHDKKIETIYIKINLVYMHCINHEWGIKIECCQNTLDWLLKTVPPQSRQNQGQISGHWGSFLRTIAKGVLQ